LRNDRQGKLVHRDSNWEGRRREHFGRGKPTGNRRDREPFPPFGFANNFGRHLVAEKVSVPDCSVVAGMRRRPSSETPARNSPRHARDVVLGCSAAARVAETVAMPMGTLVRVRNLINGGETAGERRVQRQGVAGTDIKESTIWVGCETWDDQIPDQHLICEIDSEGFDVGGYTTICKCQAAEVVNHGSGVAAGDWKISGQDVARRGCYGAIEKPSPTRAFTVVASNSTLVSPPVIMAS
jgi:hypothetical protein